jgi:hypothetical protein
MASKKKKISFDYLGMANFTHVNDAVNYFVLLENGLNDKRSIVSLFNDVHQFNVGSVSINLSHFRNKSNFDYGKFESFLRRNNLFQNPAHNEIIIKKLNEKIDSWKS